MVRALITALLGLGAASIVSGCAWLYALGGPYPMPEPPGKPATYSDGRATLTIGTAPAIELGELTEGGTIAADYGVNASFRSADGWYLRILGAGEGSPLYSPAFLTIDRIVGTEHWTTYDGSRCTVSVTKADETGLTGTASCKGLRWSDALRSGVGTSFEPPYIEDEPAFDAEITFEAKPSSTQTS
jgi:hypothetical protein